jgi:adenosylmethionine-8-amino-7-oxononanoate aminotransferase
MNVKDKVDFQGSLLVRNFRKDYPVAVRGEGVWIWDAARNRYLDFSGSSAVNLIGHGDREIAEAVAGQIAKLEFVHSSQFVTDVSLEFANEVLQFAGPGFEGGAVFFTSGGSEAVESALKLARQYQVEIGQIQRNRLLSRRQSYHGATFGAMTVSGNRKRREMYLPMLRAYEQVNTPYCYRCQYGGDDCAAKYAAEVERELERTGKDTAAFIFEPVSGATLGAVAPPDGYLKRVTDACRAHGVLTIADEVMTGFCRTGANFACAHWNTVSDIIVAGKGVSSGYAPLGAVIASRKVVDAIRNGSGNLVHGFTYNAHPPSLAAGRSVLARLQHDEFAANAKEAAHALGKSLRQLAARPSVGDVRGIGLLWGVEFVVDKASRRPYAPGKQFAAKVAAAAARLDVMTYPMQGCVDGITGDHLLIAPPAVIKREEIEFAVEQIGRAVEETTNSCR